MCNTNEELIESYTVLPPKRGDGRNESMKFQLSAKAANYSTPGPDCFDRIVTSTVFTSQHYQLKRAGPTPFVGKWRCIHIATSSIFLFANAKVIFVDVSICCDKRLGAWPMPWKRMVLWWRKRAIAWGNSVRDLVGMTTVERRARCCVSHCKPCQSRWRTQ